MTRRGGRRPSRGLLITFEGGEGSGKSTQARLLARRLEAAGYGVTLTREPAGTEAGRLAWEGIARGGLDPYTELFLFLAARSDHTARVIAPALEAGRVVVCDRFADSTVAYQGYGRGLDPRLLQRLNRLATRGLRPDLIFLLDLPVKEGLARQGRAGNDRDAIGRETVAFHERVRRGYLTLGRAEPRRWAVLDARRPLEELAEEVWQSAKPLLKRRQLSWNRPSLSKA
jgi:dTMP kinase